MTDTVEEKPPPRVSNDEASPPAAGASVSSAEAGAGDEDLITGFALLPLISSLTLIIFLVMLDISIIGTAIPRITSEFHRLGDVGWYVGAYQLSSATMQPLTGKLFAHLSIKARTVHPRRRTNLTSDPDLVDLSRLLLRL
jgi:hypothetical protein